MVALEQSAARTAAAPTTGGSTMSVDTSAVRRAAAEIERWQRGRTARPSLDPVHETFLETLSCPRLLVGSAPPTLQPASLDSLCNLR
jgi:hypothetical protein